MKRSKLMKSVWKFFCSPKLLLLLLALIIAASIAGTLIQQNAPLDVYVDSYGLLFSGLLHLTGMVDVYHSWWFVSLLALLSLNIIVCSLDRLLKTGTLLKTTAIIVKQGFVTGQKDSAHVEYKGSLKELLDIFRDKNYKMKSYKENDHTYILAEKGVISRFGSFITHMSIIIILIGALIGSLKGFKEDMSIFEGESLPVPHADFNIRLDHFKVEFYEGSQRPKEYTSRVTIIKQDKEILEKTIEVNDPLVFDGIYFYQSTYGDSSFPEAVVIRVDERAHGEEKETAYLADFTVKMDEHFVIPKSPYAVKLNRFVPDFTIDADDTVSSRSHELINPAVQLLVYKNNIFLFDIWSFPGIGVPHFPEEFGYNFTIHDLHFKQFSGLQVVYDPGVPVVWLGCGLLILGLFVSFYVFHRRIWIIGRSSKHGWNLVIGGNTNKNQHGFKNEFNSLIENIKGV